MKIVVDENIPFAKEAFGQFGQVVTRPGRQITRDDLKDAELLIVRSVTPVTAELLDGTPIRFVGTCTIGTDHVDQAYLAERGIAFANAAGSNAESVAEYVVSALLTLAERHGIELAGRTLGVVGVGNVGSRVARNASALGMHVVLNDPPLYRQTGDPKYRPLDELLHVDFLTLHVPLTRTGPDPTWHLVDDHLLQRLRPGAFLLNTSRGPVVDNAALLQCLQQGQLAGAVLDVWEGEPRIDHRLLQRVDLGTPHIAGYSFDGKVKATEMIYEAVCRFLDEQPRWNAANVLQQSLGTFTLRTDGRTREAVLREAVRLAYDIRRDDADLRRSLELPESEQPAYFDQLRKNYWHRREFPSVTLRLQPFDTELACTLRSLRFQVDPSK